MSTTVGTWPLIRLILRRDRWILPVWILLPSVLLAVTASAFSDLYPTPESREQFATLMATNPGITAFLGPLHGSSIGALTFWRTVIIGVVLAGLVPMFTIIRHTRAEEQAGRRELLGSTVVGRHAPLAAAAAVTAGYSILMGIGVTLGLVAAGLEVTGSIAAGATWAAFAVACAAIGSLAAQLVENARTVRGIGASVLAGAYLVRIAGDTAGGAVGWIWWASPVSWMHAVRPFDANRWWVLLLFAGGAVAAGSAAFILSARRDLDTGVLPARLGSERAHPRLRTPLALAWRLHRASFFGWAAGIGLYGAVVGGLGPSMADILEGNPQLKEIFRRLGGEGIFIDIFLAAGLAIVAMITAAYAVQAALRIRGEEQAGYAEVVLATPVTRARYLVSHAVIVAGAPSAAMLFAGLVAGVTYGVVTGDVIGEAPRLAAASAAHLPALLVMGGLTLVLFGLVPAASSMAWAIIVFFLVVGQLGPVLGLDQWVMNLSPFTHTPAVPGERLNATPLIWMTITAGGLAVAGLEAFRRRDAGIG